MSQPHDTSADVTSVGERIRSLRKRKGWSQDELAQLVGAQGGRQTVIRWEQDTNEPKEFATELARVFEVPEETFRRTPEELVTLNDLRRRLAEAEAALNAAGPLLEALVGRVEALERAATARRAEA